MEQRSLDILLVEDEQDVCQKFKAEIDETTDMKLIGITNNSYQAIQLTKDYSPSVVVLDLELHYGKGNGLQYLQDLKNLSLPFKPYLLVVTNNSSPTTYQFARELGADFIIYKHQNDYSEKNVIEFLKMMTSIIQSNQHKTEPPSATSESPAEKNQRLRRIISTELDYVGISPKSVGYQYLIDAILKSIDGMQNNIVISVAEKYKKTPTSVERGMQNAIDRAWRTADIDELLQHYKAKINSHKGVPTITEFICYYANKIKNEH